VGVTPTLEEYEMSQRKEYVAKMKAKLDEWNAEIEELEARARKAGARAEKHYWDRIADLKNKRDGGRKKLDEIRDATDDAWETLQSGAEIMWSEMKSTLKQARDAFKGGLRD
jgi:uncharacterized coiled-coil DUF342 family protein